MNSTIFRLGLVSFFADISSEMLYPVTPLFLTVVLGSSMLQVGVIEGAAEGIASLLKTYFGAWSDRTQKRLPFVFTGYLLSALSKPLIGLSSSWFGVLGARAVDRVGKGVRTAPRDALLGESVVAEERGRAFGFHRGMDSAGAAIGPLLALFVTSENMRQYYYWAVVPGLIAAALVLTVRPLGTPQVTPKKPPAPKVAFSVFWRAQTSNFKKFAFALGIFAFTNSSDAFLLLKVKASGYSFFATIMFYCLYNLIYSIFSPIFGRFSDRSRHGFIYGRQRMFSIGLLIFVLVYIGFSIAHLSLWAFGLLFLCYGLYMAATDGISKALALDFMTTEMHATGLGLIGTITGIATIFASVSAGFLWDHLGPSFAFLYGASGAIVTIVLILGLKTKIPH